MNDWEQEVAAIMEKVAQMDADGVQMVAEALADILQNGVVPDYRKEGNGNV